MGDSAKIAKARRELEELYLGIPDDSVNLTFGDLAEVRQPSGSGHPLDQKKNSPPATQLLDPIVEASPRNEEVKPLTKLPSLDFSRALEASAQYNYENKHHLMHHNHHPLKNIRNDYNPSQMNHNHLHIITGELDQKPHHRLYGTRGGNTPQPQPPLSPSTPPPPHHHHFIGSPYGGSQHSMMYDDMSQMSGFGADRGGGRRRPGIPHTNICTICSIYIYLFRHRCLVCGRVYCRQCVNIGMGDMSEGRKCIECLGRRFSPRYIHKAGEIGCCMGYPSLVKQQELKWAEKGPRGRGENRQARSEMMSRSINPSPIISARGHTHHTKSQPSFVSNSHAQASFAMGSPSPYSPYYSPRNHPLPF